MLRPLPTKMFALIVPLLAVAACDARFGGGGGGLFDVVTVRVFNNTDFEVDPRVGVGVTRTVFDELDTGILGSGDIVEFDLNCDDAIYLTATESAQLGTAEDFVLDPLPVFEIDQEYFCGELVEFEFVGNGRDFNVFVDAGGQNIF